jgi:hypothetical protein
MPWTPINGVRIMAHICKEYRLETSYLLQLLAKKL